MIIQLSRRQGSSRLGCELTNHYFVSMQSLSSTEHEKRQAYLRLSLLGFSNILLARLYPFEIGAIFDGVWIAVGEPNFFRHAMFD